MIKSGLSKAMSTYVDEFDACIILYGVTLLFVIAIWVVFQNMVISTFS